MAKKAKRAAAADDGPVTKTDRWTVRGVPAALQKAAGDAARLEGVTLGRWLTAALERTLVTSGHRAGQGQAWRDEVETRLVRLERALGIDPTAPVAALDEANAIGATER